MLPSKYDNASNVNINSYMSPSTVNLIQSNNQSNYKSS